MARNLMQVQRLNRLITRLSNGTRCLGSPGIANDEHKLAVEVVQASHDILGGLVASRVALSDACIVTSVGHEQAKAAAQAIIDAERAILYWRDQLCTLGGGITPPEAEAER
jgi:hypothetical protein